MDPIKCVEILNSRFQSNDSNNKLNRDENINKNQELNETINLNNNLNEISAINLIKLFCSLQHERIRTYQYYNTELVLLIEQKSPARYPLICAEVTNKFSNLSLTINKIKDIFIERNMIDISNLINTVQLCEKDKLMYVAAKHLDQLQELVQGLSSVIGMETINQLEYLSKKIQETENIISEQIESIMCILQDLYESES